MKNKINFLLSRMPRIYKFILKIKGNKNLEKAVFLSLVDDGDIVFDIGANRGYYTILFSHLVGKQGQVYAFEPVPPTFNQLNMTVLSEKIFDNIELNNLALGNTNSEINIYMPDQDDGQASLAKTHSVGSWINTEVVNEYPCKVVKLDDYVKDNAVRRLDFVKCDVEGYELLALQGATEVIGKYLPIIYLEVFDQWTTSFGYLPNDILDFLSPFGYSQFYLVGQESQCISEPIANINSLSGCANLICIVPDIHKSRVERLKTI